MDTLDLPNYTITIKGDQALITHKKTGASETVSVAKLDRWCASVIRAIFK